jgi:hypothetical protein
MLPEPVNGDIAWITDDIDYGTYLKSSLTKLKVMWGNIASFENGDVSRVFGVASMPEQGVFDFTLESFGTSIPETIRVEKLAPWKRQNKS